MKEQMEGSKKAPGKASPKKQEKAKTEVKEVEPADKVEEKAEKPTTKKETLKL